MRVHRARAEPPRAPAPPRRTRTARVTVHSLCMLRLVATAVLARSSASCDGPRARMHAQPDEGVACSCLSMYTDISL